VGKAAVGSWQLAVAVAVALAVAVGNWEQRLAIGSSGWEEGESAVAASFAKATVADKNYGGRRVKGGERGVAVCLFVVPGSWPRFLLSLLRGCLPPNPMKREQKSFGRWLFIFIMEALL